MSLILQLFDIKYIKPIFFGDSKDPGSNVSPQIPSLSDERSESRSHFVKGDGAQHQGALCHEAGSHS